MFFTEGHLTDKSDDKVGHLNTILARGGGNLNDPIFKSSNARGLRGRGGGDVEVSRLIGALAERGHLQILIQATDFLQKFLVLLGIQRLKNYRFDREFVLKYYSN